MQFRQLMNLMKARQYHHTVIDLSDLALTSAEIAEFVAELNANHELKQHLVSLKLGKSTDSKKNSFTSVLELDGFPALANLEVAGLGLSGLRLRNMPQLRDLDASHNQLVEPELYNVAGLRKINFSNNRIHAFNPALFKRLCDLDLSNNLIGILDVSLLLDFSSLRVAGNPLVTLLFHGTSFPDGMYYNSELFDPVTRKIVADHKRASPDYFHDAYLPQAPFAEREEVTIAHISDYLDSAFAAYKQGHARQDLTNTTQRLIVSPVCKGTSMVPTDLSAKVAAYDFCDRMQKYFDRIEITLKSHKMHGPRIAEQMEIMLSEFLFKGYHTAAKVLANNKALATLSAKRIGELGGVVVASKPKAASPTRKPSTEMIVPVPRKTLLFDYKTPFSSLVRLCAKGRAAKAEETAVNKPS